MKKKQTKKKQEKKPEHDKKEASEQVLAESTNRVFERLKNGITSWQNICWKVVKWLQNFKHSA